MLCQEKTIQNQRFFTIEILSKIWMSLQKSLVTNFKRLSKSFSDAATVGVL